MKKLLYIIPIIFILFSCTQDFKDDKSESKVGNLPKAKFEYGYDFNEYNVIRDTIRSGDTFGEILDANHVPQNGLHQCRDM